MKLTILLQYIEIFAYRSVNRKMFWLCSFMIFANFVLYFTSVVLEIFVCRGSHTPWFSLSGHDSCPLNILQLSVAVNAFNSLSNIAILILPQMSIWNLQLAREKKIGISILFFMGLFACIASIVHLTYTTIILRGTDNIAYYLFLSALWTYPETSFGIVIACVPVMPKFFREMRDRVRKSKSASRVCFCCQRRSAPLPSRKTRSSHMRTTDGAFSDDEPLTELHGTTGSSDSLVAGYAERTNSNGSGLIFLSISRDGRYANAMPDDIRTRVLEHILIRDQNMIPPTCYKPPAQ
ncbi:hypothetical protein PISL3812_03027 [Talaromyces islandicus]|uniref:Rhodopsin domain-containing protein n=1 Tax=Talaromyces islandicus TaxID=28573 RepID=A0A0U1LRK2_TALIS|nr:hypothetical protein PISL3812_03027 [Talaromyces islandicus]